MCAHPGSAVTGLHMKSAANGATTWADNSRLNAAFKKGQSTEDGTVGILKACCDSSMRSGDFLGPKHAAGDAEVLPAERDEAAQKLCWDASMVACGVKEFGKA